MALSQSKMRCQRSHRCSLRAPAQFRGSATQRKALPPAPVFGVDATLPGGTAMMTFAVASLEGTGLDFPWPVVQMTSASYGGARSTVVLGPGGERLELVEVAP